METKRLFSLFLVLVMLLSLMPSFAFAAPGQEIGSGDGDPGEGRLTQVPKEEAQGLLAEDEAAGNPPPSGRISSFYYIQTPTGGTVSAEPAIKIGDGSETTQLGSASVKLFATADPGYVLKGWEAVQVDYQTHEPIEGGYEIPITNDGNWYTLNITQTASMMRGKREGRLPGPGPLHRRCRPA